MNWAKECNCTQVKDGTNSRINERLDEIMNKITNKTVTRKTQRDECHRLNRLTSSAFLSPLILLSPSTSLAVKKPLTPSIACRWKGRRACHCEIVRYDPLNAALYANEKSIAKRAWNFVIKRIILVGYLIMSQLQWWVIVSPGNHW